MLHKYIVTLTDAEGVLLDQWVLERPQENVEDPWLTETGRLNAGAAAELGREIGAEIFKHAAGL